MKSRPAASGRLCRMLLRRHRRRPATSPQLAAVERLQVEAAVRVETYGMTTEQADVLIDSLRRIRDRRDEQRLREVTCDHDPGEDHAAVGKTGTDGEPSS